MADKNLIWNRTSAFIGVIAIVVTIGISWYLNREKSTILNVEKVSEILLTNPLNVEGLTSSYMYNDSIEVKNLWRTTFVIRNVGKKTIYGKGFPEQSIRDLYIPFLIKSCEKLLSVIITNENNEAWIAEPLKLGIIQWKPEEYVEITTLTDGNNSPDLIINDREIKDSKITYSVYSAEKINENENKNLIEYFPKGIANTLKWIIVVVMVFLFIAAIFTIPDQVKTASKGQKILTLALWLFFLIILFCPILWMF
ncbi:MAG: hypothetical protein FWC10_01780 [Lentimicrobiaceae bacterium]|nr:hypothetical protein [Lentimicrobiaceae bacterium]